MRLRTKDSELENNPAVTKWLEDAGKFLPSDEDFVKCQYDMLYYGSAMMRMVDGKLTRVAPEEWAMVPEAERKVIQTDPTP